MIRSGNTIRVDRCGPLIFTRTHWLRLLGMAVRFRNLMDPVCSSFRLRKSLTFCIAFSKRRGIYTKNWSVRSFPISIAFPVFLDRSFFPPLGHELIHLFGPKSQVFANSRSAEKKVYGLTRSLSSLAELVALQVESVLELRVRTRLYPQRVPQHRGSVVKWRVCLLVNIHLHQLPVGSFGSLKSIASKEWPVLPLRVRTGVVE